MREKSRRYSLAYFCLFAIYGVVSPYLQLLLRGLGYGPAGVGLFLALFEVVGIVGPLALSRLADRSGKRKPTLAASALAILVALPALVLLPLRLVTGLSIAVFAIGVKTLIPVMDAQGMAFVDAGPEAGKKSGYGALRVMGSIGFIATALVLQFIPGFDRSPPWLIALCVAAATLVFLLSLLFLPESPALPATPEPGRKGPRGATRIDPVFALGLLVIGVGRFAMAPINSFISLYATESLHFHAVGALWALASATEIPLMLVAGSIIARTGAMGAIAIATAAVGLRLAVYAIFPSPAGLLSAQLLHALCYGLFQPAAVTFVAERVHPSRRSTGMALYMGLGVGVPAVLGSALGGFVVEAAGYRALFLSFIAFSLASLCLFAVFRKRFSLAASR